MRLIASWCRNRRWPDPQRLSQGSRAASGHHGGIGRGLQGWSKRGHGGVLRKRSSAERRFTGLDGFSGDTHDGCGNVVDMHSAQVFSGALSLSEEERAELAHVLLVSLHGSVQNMDEEAAAAWCEEVERRARAVADGTAKLVDWEVACARIEAKLRDRRAARSGR